MVVAAAAVAVSLGRPWKQRNANGATNRSRKSITIDLLENVRQKVINLSHADISKYSHP